MGVGVFARNHVDDQPCVRVVHHQGVSRQGGAPKTAQCRETLLAGRQMVAIDDPHLVARHNRSLVAAQLSGNLPQAFRAADDQRPRQAHLRTVDLVVERRQRDSDVLAGSRRRMDGWLQAKRHDGHQFHRRREQGLPGVLAFPVFLEKPINPPSFKCSFESRSRHYRCGASLYESFQNRVENHDTGFNIRIDPRSNSDPFAGSPTSAY